MSFLARIAERAATARFPVTPKGFVRRAPAVESAPEDETEMQPLRRQENGPEEEEAQPLRRNAILGRSVWRAAEDESKEEPEAQPLRRAAADEKDEAQPLRRQAEEEEESLQSLRRQPEEEEEEEEEDVQALRRQPEEEEEAAQPLRRQPEDEEKGESLQPIRRQPEEEQDEETAPPLRREAALDPAAAPFPEEMRDEPEPELGPMRRAPLDGGPAPGASVPAFGFDPGAWPGPAPMEPQRPAEGFARPSVHIDQIDVLIHEPAAARGAGRPADRSRAIRARYLRRL